LNQHSSSETRTTCEINSSLSSVSRIYITSVRTVFLAQGTSRP